MAVVFKNNSSTTLNGDITNSATSITVLSGAVFPQVVTRSAITVPVAGAATSTITGSKLLLQYDGGNNSTTYTDTVRSNRTFTNTAPAKQSTTIAPVLGNSSFTTGNTGYLKVTSDLADFAFGTSDWTFDTYFYKTSNTGYQAIYDAGHLAAGSVLLEIVAGSATSIYLYISGVSVKNFTGSAYSLNTWNHLALVKSSGTYYLSVNGVSWGSQANATSITTPTRLQIGAYNDAASEVFQGYLDMTRFSNTALWTSFPHSLPTTTLDYLTYGDPTQSSSTNTADAGDYFYATISDGTNTEVVKVTNVSTNTLTVVRAQDGSGVLANTTGYAFNSGTTIQIRPTNQGLIDLRNDQLFREVAYSNNKYLGAL